jgi:ATP-dependent RNA helicase DDX31/DBP7
MHIAVNDIMRDNEDLKQMARTAFTAFLRAYATTSRLVRYIFHPRRLHLGHVARSFGLDEAPSHIAALVEQSLGQENATNRHVYRRLERAKEGEARVRKVAEKQKKSYNEMLVDIAKKKNTKFVAMSE